jgi:hypothetical protein
MSDTTRCFMAFHPDVCPWREPLLIDPAFEAWLAALTCPRCGSRLWHHGVRRVLSLRGFYLRFGCANGHVFDRLWR